LVGAEGKGESVLNSATAVYTWSYFLPLAKRRKDLEFVQVLEAEIEKVRAGVDKQFDREWFIRGFTDDGKPIGDHASDQLFISVQSFAALADCSDKSKLRKALLNAVKKCSTPLGPTLMSKPYSLPAPNDITYCQYLKGEGENAGIWWYQGHLLALALAKQEFVSEVWDMWRCMTCHRHVKLFPHIWYGTWCCPDTFNSYFSSQPGRTQKHGWNRTSYPNSYDSQAAQVWVFLRLLITPTDEGYIIDPRIPSQKFSLKTRFLEITKSEREYILKVGRPVVIILKESSFDKIEVILEDETISLIKATKEKMKEIKFLAQVKINQKRVQFYRIQKST